MPKKPENTFRASVHRHLPKTLHHEKMSNPYRIGGADDWYSGTLGDLWIEFKFTRVPRRPTTPVIPTLSDMQKKWCRERFEEGRFVRVIVGSPIGGVIFNSPDDWEKGITQAVFMERLQSREQLAEFIVRICNGSKTNSGSSKSGRKPA